MPDKTKKEDKVTAALLSLAEAIKVNTEAVSQLINKPATPVAAPAVSVPTPAEPAPLPTTTLVPVPLEYRQIVDSVLNKSFEVELQPVLDQPAFQFIIVVPDKYSTISDDYRRLYKRDLRPRVITYADGSSAVRMWAEKVFSNFNQDLRSMIVADRVQGH